jgi:hypothetical protein
VTSDACVVNVGDSLGGLLFCRQPRSTCVHGSNSGGSEKVWNTEHMAAPRSALAPSWARNWTCQHCWIILVELRLILGGRTGHGNDPHLTQPGPGSDDNQTWASLWRDHLQMIQIPLNTSSVELIVAGDDSPVGIISRSTPPVLRAETQNGHVDIQIMDRR